MKRTGKTKRKRKTATLDSFTTGLRHKVEASFAKVFANTYLEGTAKTALENAKINLWGQRDTLLSAYREW